MIFNVIVTETRSKVIRVDAPTESEAIGQVEKKYLNEDIVLNNDDFEDVKYTTLEE